MIVRVIKYVILVHFIVAAREPICGITLEARVKSLARVQYVIAEKFGPGLPEKFPNTSMYQEELRNYFINLMFPATDSDHDNMLNGDEFHKLFVVLLEEDEIIDICESDYLSFCDGDNDGMVRKEELEKCIGAIPCE